MGVHVRARVCVCVCAFVWLCFLHGASAARLVIGIQGRCFRAFHFLFRGIVCQVHEHPATVYVAYCFLALEIGWIAFWVFCYSAVIKVAPNGFTGFFMLLSLLWTHEIKKNIVHTTAAGVAGSWFFCPGAPSIVGPSLQRACTTSFGTRAVFLLALPFVF